MAITNKYILAIPFYKNEHFIEGFIDWFNHPKAEEDKLLIENVVVYNDYPDSEGSNYLKEKCLHAGFTYIANSCNIGYLKTANLAYEEAKNRSCNLLLLNSDTIPFAGFLSEINNCFLLDSMLGIVSARSNNATICNIYDHPDYFEGEKSLHKYDLDRRTFAKYTPSITYAPVVTGFCFAIRGKVLQAFQGFDEIYTVGYEEENDYCLRVSERGFRVGIANKAFVAHMEGQSFGLTNYREKIKEGNAKIIRARYNYYDAIIDSYANSISHIAENRVSRATSNRCKHAIDARVLAPYHNGSNKFILEFITAFSSLGIPVDILTNSAAVKFHKLDSLPNVKLVNKFTQVYEYGFMLGQPMLHSTLWTIPLHSLVSVCIFFDTIAHDCPQLKHENLALDSIWSKIPYIYTDISFISHHSKIQFELKFGSGSCKLHSHLLPIKLSENFNKVTSDSETALVFGNKFLHKGIDLLLDELPRNGSIKYYVLGSSIGASRSDVMFLPPGETSEKRLDQLMQTVDFVLMPSFAEGFGFPLIEALSYGKPIYCREIECFKEIREAISVEKRHLIKLVDNFFNLSITEERPSIAHHSNVFNTYPEYISKLMDDVQAKCAKSFFSSLKARLLLLESQTIHSHSNNVTKTIRFVYRLFLRTPAASQVRKVKSWFFSYSYIRNLFLGH